MTEKNEGSDAPVMVVVAYKPLAGKESALLDLTRKHVPVLRSQGLVTDREPYAMRAKDGTVIEVFEWKSEAAVNSAHNNPVVLGMWKEYGEACIILPLNKVAECGDMFAGFEPVDLSL